MNASRKEMRLAYALLLIVPTMWSMNYIVARLAPGVIAPHTLALGRWALASAILCLVTRRELWARRGEIRRDRLRYLVLGTLGMLVCGAWVYIAGRSTSTMNMALIYAAAPVLILIGSVLWLGERMTGPRLAGTVLSLAGVVHVTVKGHWNALAGVHFSSGDLWIVCATLGWAAYSLLLRIWPSTLSASARVAVTSFAGSCVLLPFAIWEHAVSGPGAWSTQAVSLVIVAAVFPGVLAYWGYGRAQQILGSARAATSLYLAPLFAAMAAYAVLGERLAAFHLVGGAMVLGGLALATWRRSAAGAAA